MKGLDLAGKRFGSLTVISRIGSRWGHSLWLCQCDCGNKCERTANQFQVNTCISCGCKTKEAQHMGFLKHGMTGSRIYRIWKAMKTRCYNANTSYFKYYGGKGIAICDEWRNDFQTFYEWSIHHGYSESLTIDRIDSDKDYSPDNCRWVDMTVQNRNKKKVRECLKASQIS